ncbi:MAG: proton-conducting transporter membrane subunit, partial [Acidimicrobiales bacterium]
GAGSVIHGMDGEQDMRRYGALAKVMPITAGTFIVGWLAIAGVPPFSGFWSKDEDLLAAFNENVVLWALLLLAAIMTALYMSRMVFMTFFGEARWADSPEPDPDSDTAAPPDSETGPVVVTAHPHESPWLMWVPLVVLAVLALLAGGINLPFSDNVQFLENWLEPVLFGNEVEVTAGRGTQVILAIAAVTGAAIGITLAAVIYLGKRISPATVELPILANGWRYDRYVTAFMGGPGRRLFDLATWFDRTIVDGAVNGAAKVSTTVGTRMRTIQTGLVRTYALAVVLGTVVVLTYFVARITF